MNILLYKLVLFLFVLLFISACSGKDGNVSVPKNLISEETFTKVLVDFALAESTTNINVKNLPLQKMDSAYAFNPLKENKVSKAAYDSAVEFYSQHPGLYKKIYENVLATLSKLQIKSDTAKTNPILK